MQRAIHVHGKFVEAFELLAFQPGSDATRPKLTGEGVRWWPVFRRLVIYDPSSSPITILRVIHGAREFDRLLHGDESLRASSHRARILGPLDPLMLERHAPVWGGSTWVATTDAIETEGAPLTGGGGRGVR